MCISHFIDDSNPILTHPLVPSLSSSLTPPLSLLPRLQQVIQEKKGRSATFHPSQPARDSARGAANLPPSYISSLPDHKDDPEAALLSASDLPAKGTKPGSEAVGAGSPAIASAKGGGQLFIALQDDDSVHSRGSRGTAEARAKRRAQDAGGGTGGKREACVEVSPSLGAAAAATTRGDGEEEGNEGSRTEAACYACDSDGPSRASFKNVRLGVFHFKMRLNRFATNQEVAFKFARVVDLVCGIALFVAYVVAVVIIFTYSGSK